MQRLITSIGGDSILQSRLRRSILSLPAEMELFARLARRRCLRRAKAHAPVPATASRCSMRSTAAIRLRTRCCTHSTCNSTARVSARCRWPSARRSWRGGLKPVHDSLASHGKLNDLLLDHVRAGRLKGLGVSRLSRSPLRAECADNQRVGLDDRLGAGKQCREQTRPLLSSHPSDTSFWHALMHGQASDCGPGRVSPHARDHRWKGSINTPVLWSRGAARKRTPQR
jgi:hypothetical protein